MDNFDQEIKKAVKARILAELEAKQQAQVVNNVFGGGGESRGSGTLSERFAPGSSVEDPFDYMVDIERRNVADKDGNILGWNKKVHRYRKPKRAGESEE